MPDPKNTAADPFKESRLGGPLEVQTVYHPAAYTGPREGWGRWVILYGLGGVQLGYLWATETGLGFVASSDAGLVRLPEFYTAFHKAAEFGAPTGDVFDAWAAKDGQSLSAGPVGEGDVATLPA